MVIDRLQRAIDRAAGLPEATQEAVAELLEQLLQRYEGQPPELDPELSAVVEQSMSEFADTLKAVHEAFLSGFKRHGDNGKLAAPAHAPIV